MSILALAMYGSCARGDQHKDSDVDLFAITSDSEYKMIVKNKLNVASYPRDLALNHAGAGDLFFFHIVTEGKVIYDSKNYFSELVNSFRHRDSYLETVQNASDLGWFLIDAAEQAINFTLINKRVAWCVRTILIAKAAERRIPCFSNERLTEFSGYRITSELIENKNSDFYNKRILEHFSIFLNKFGHSRPKVNKKNVFDEYNRHFNNSGNDFAKKTVKMVLTAASIMESYR